MADPFFSDEAIYRGKDIATVEAGLASRDGGSGPRRIGSRSVDSFTEILF
jgi:hypothetical protein